MAIISHFRSYLRAGQNSSDTSRWIIWPEVGHWRDRKWCAHDRVRSDIAARKRTLIARHPSTVPKRHEIHWPPPPTEGQCAMEWSPNPCTTWLSALELWQVPPLAVLPKAARNSIPDLVSRPGEYTTALVRSGKPYLRHLILHEQEWYRRRGYLRSGNEYGRESDGGRSKVCGPGLLNKQQLQGSAGAKCSSTPLHHQSSSSSDHVQMAHHHPLSSPLSAGIVAGSTSRILPRSSSSDSSAGRLRIYPGDSV
ncbi:hypothetical protein Tco_1202641 [Tanacetum coccineum]